MAELTRRVYSNFRGVDFSNEASLVDISRSPDALNVWKNYNDTQGECIETRPGLRLLGQIGEKILGIYCFTDSKAIVHSKTNLYEWSNFPDTPTNETLRILSSSMNINNRTSFNRFGNYLFINDGTNYLRYDGTNLVSVSSVAFVPTTTIGRNPSGGGEMYQDVNVLTNQRKNSFKADGTSTNYQLDAVGITSVDEVKVNDTIVSNYTVNELTGTVTFETAPTAPTLGQDNVVVTFTKVVSGYSDRIAKCTKALIWDNRMFYTGNPAYPNVLFNCKLNDPTYVSDLAYYEEGNSDSAIKDIVVGADVLWVFKDKDQNNANVFYHTKTTTEEAGNIYPNKQGNVEMGCYAKAINFLDDIVYLSRSGLQGIITAQLENKQIISPRSHLVNSKLINNSNYYDAQMENWNGYLLILVGDEIYLADSRQKVEYLSSYEYEWYFWKFTQVIPNLLKNYNGNLYIGANDGKIYKVDGTNDNGEIINSYWITPMDNFKYPNHYKTTNKRGGIAKLKSMQNGKVKLGIRTDKMPDFDYSTEKNLKGFDFNNIDFSNFSFATTKELFLIYKVKQKKIKEIALKIYSDELNKPFGIYSMIIEAFIGGYAKK